MGRPRSEHHDAGLAPSAGPGGAALRDRGRWAAKAAAAVLLGWTAVALVATLEQVAADSLAGRDPASFWRALGAQASVLWVWAAATPAILWSARRFPVAGRLRLRNLGLHVAAGSAFVLALNVIIRLPGTALDAASLTRVLRGGLLGFVRWYHMALLVYLGLVGIGHLRGSAAARGGPRRPYRAYRAYRPHRSARRDRRRRPDRRRRVAHARPSPHRPDRRRRAARPDR